MTTRFAIIGWSTGIFLVAMVLGLALMRTNQPPLTGYRGKPIGEWAIQYHRGSSAAHAEAEAAFRAMGPQALPELRRLLVRDDPVWRRVVWDPQSNIPRPLRRQLIRVVAEPVAFMRREAAAASLAIYGPQAEPAIPELIRGLACPPTTRICVESAETLGRVGKAAVPALVTATHSPNGQVRYWAAYALGQVGPSAMEAAPRLAQLLEDGQVCQMAASALGRMGPSAVPVLTNCLEGTSPLVLEKAMLSLGQIGSAAQAALPLLRRWEHAESAPPAVRTAAQQAIEKIQE